MSDELMKYKRLEQPQILFFFSQTEIMHMNGGASGKAQGPARI